MQRSHKFTQLGLLLVLVINFAGCARLRADYEVQKAAPANPTPGFSLAPVPKEIAAADLAKLRWIEGTWRGTGGGVPTFYERYKFENDTTLTVESFEDETLNKVSDVSRFELKDGHFAYKTDAAGSVAIALDDSSITFAPLGKGNFFRWQRESQDAWKAVLNWTDKSAAKERVYQMERWPAKKP